MCVVLMIETVDNDLRIMACHGKIKVVHMRWLEIRLIIDHKGKENSNASRQIIVRASSFG